MKKFLIMSLALLVSTSLSAATADQNWSEMTFEDWQSTLADLIGKDGYQFIDLTKSLPLELTNLYSRGMQLTLKQPKRPRQEIKRVRHPDLFQVIYNDLGELKPPEFLGNSSELEIIARTCEGTGAPYAQPITSIYINAGFNSRVERYLITSWQDLSSFSNFLKSSVKWAGQRNDLGPLKVEINNDMAQIISSGQLGPKLIVSIGGDTLYWEFESDSVCSTQ